MDSETLHNCLRKVETWETAKNLTARLIQCNFSLTGNDPLRSHTKERYAPHPSFLERLMGYPARLDRTKGLGNAIVPAIAERIFNRFAELDREADA